MNFKTNCTYEFGVKCAKIQHCVSAGRLASRRQKGALDPSTVFSGKGCCLRCQSQFTWCVICIVAHEAHWALLAHTWLLRLLSSNEDTKAKSYVILIVGSRKEPWRPFQKLHQFKTFILTTKITYDMASVFSFELNGLNRQGCACLSAHECSCSTLWNPRNPTEENLMDF